MSGAVVEQGDRIALIAARFASLDLLQGMTGIRALLVKRVYASRKEI
jgi:hypothetical protein